MMKFLSLHLLEIAFPDVIIEEHFSINIFNFISNIFQNHN